MVPPPLPPPQNNTGPPRTTGTRATNGAVPTGAVAASISTVTVVAEYFQAEMDNNTTFFQGLMSALNGIHQSQQINAQATATSNDPVALAENKDVQNEINRKFEAIIAYKMDTFCAQRPADWVNGLQKMLKTYRVEFLDPQELTTEAREKGITEDMRDALEAAAMITAESLPIEVKTRLGLDRAQVSVASPIVLMLGRYMDKSEGRHDKLRPVTDKIKMRRNISVVE